MTLSNSSINEITDQLLYMTNSFASISLTNITNILNDD